MYKMLLATTMFATLVACSAAAQSDGPAYVAPLEIEAADAIGLAEAMQGAPVSEAAYATPAAYESAAMRCDIEARRSGGMVRLVAFASSPDAAFGEYELVFTKHDAGGSSDIMQGGEFDVDGDHQELGVIETSLERGGRYSARLTLFDADGVVCETDVSR